MKGLEKYENQPIVRAKVNNSSNSIELGIKQLFSFHTYKETLKNYKFPLQSHHTTYINNNNIKISR